MWTLRRPAARVVLFDRDFNVFLIQSRDPADATKPTWLEIPGGGVDRGENTTGTVRRELYEEAGIESVEIGPVVWTQYVEYEFGGYRFESDECIHIAWCDGGDWQPKKLEFLEAAAFIEAGWWTIGDLLDSPLAVVPARLREFLPELVSGPLPSRPIDISPELPKA